MKVRFKNDTGETIPAWAVIQVTEASRLANKRICVTAEKPGEEVPVTYITNGPVAVEDGNYGTGRAEEFVWVATDGAVSDGVELGPVSGEWTIGEGGTGYLVLHYDSDKEIALCRVLSFGVTDGDGDGGAPGDGPCCGRPLDFRLGISGAGCAAVPSGYAMAPGFQLDVPDYPGIPEGLRNKKLLFNYDSGCEYVTDTFELECDAADPTGTGTTGTGSTGTGSTGTGTGYDSGMFRARIEMFARTVNSTTIMPSAFLHIERVSGSCEYELLAYSYDFNVLRGGQFIIQTGRCLQWEGCFCVSAIAPDLPGDCPEITPASARTEPLPRVLNISVTATGDFADWDGFETQMIYRERSPMMVRNAGDCPDDTFEFTQTVDAANMGAFLTWEDCDQLPPNYSMWQSKDFLPRLSVCTTDCGGGFFDPEEDQSRIGLFLGCYTGPNEDWGCPFGTQKPSSDCQFVFLMGEVPMTMSSYSNSLMRCIRTSGTHDSGLLLQYRIDGNTTNNKYTVYDGGCINSPQGGMPDDNGLSRVAPAFNFQVVSESTPTTSNNFGEPGPGHLTGSWTITVTEGEFTGSDIQHHPCTHEDTGTGSTGTGSTGTGTGSTGTGSTGTGSGTGTGTGSTGTGSTGTGTGSTGTGGTGSGTGTGTGGTGTGTGSTGTGDSACFACIVSGEETTCLTFECYEAQEPNPDGCDSCGGGGGATPCTPGVDCCDTPGVIDCCIGGQCFADMDECICTGLGGSSAGGTCSDPDPCG